MTARIDQAALTRLGACAAGFEWLAGQAQDGGLSIDAAIEALLAAGDTGFLAWGFLRAPEWRRRAPVELQARVMGPGYHALAGLVDGLPRFHWLDPPPGDEALDLRATVETHLRRLSPLGFAPPSATVPVLRRSLVEAFRLTAADVHPEGRSGEAHDDRGVLFQAAWRAAAAASGEHRGSAAERVVAALRKADRPAAPSPWFSLRFAVEAELADNLAEIAPVRDQTREAATDLATAGTYAAACRRFARAERDPAWIAAERAVFDGEAPTDALRSVVWAGRAVSEAACRDAVGEALWLLADVESPSPFAPLLDLWRWGYWPAGLVEEGFVVGDPRLPDPVSGGQDHV